MAVYSKPKPKQPTLTGIESYLFKFIFNSKKWKWVKVLRKS